MYFTASSPITSASTAAAMILAMANGWPMNWKVSSTAPNSSSGVATSSVTAAAMGTPRSTRLRYSGSTPQEQIGNGSPNNNPRTACIPVEPRPIQSTVAFGSRAWIIPAMMYAINSGPALVRAIIMKVSKKSWVASVGE